MMGKYSIGNMIRSLNSKNAYVKPSRHNSILAPVKQAFKNAGFGFGNHTEQNKVISPTFSVSYGEKFITPNMNFSFREQSQEFENSLTLRSTIQTIIDFLKINPIVTKQINEAISIDPFEEARLKAIINKANRFQNLREVMMEFEQDCHEVNNGWVYIIWDYLYDNTKPLEGQRYQKRAFREMFRGDPQKFRWSMDKNLKPIYVRCPSHAKSTSKYEETEDGIEIIKYCPECGVVMEHVEVISLKDDGNNIEQFYIRGEYYHAGRFNSGMGDLLYNTPVLNTIWKELLTLNQLRNYRSDAFVDKKLPDGFLVVQAENPKGPFTFLKKALKRIENGDIRHLPMMFIQATQRTGDVKYVSLLENFIKTYPELEQDYRKQMRSLYGVSQVFENEVQASGGLNNESQQVNITQMHGEASLNILNLGFFEFFSMVMEMRTVMLNIPSIFSEGVIAKTKRLQGEATLAKSHLEMGGDAEYDGNNYILHKGKLSKPESSMPTMFTRNVEPIDVTKAEKEEENRPVGQIEDDMEKSLDEMFDDMNEQMGIHIQELTWKEDRAPTKEELKDILDIVIKEITSSWKNIAPDKLQAIYKYGVELSNAQEKVPWGPWTASDQESLDRYIQDPNGLKKFFKNFDKKTQGQIIEKVQKYVTADKFDKNEFVKELQNITKEISLQRAHTMATTEFGVAQSKGRIHTYEKLENEGIDVKLTIRGVFTCDICKKIRSDVNSKGGKVSIKEMNKIFSNDAPARRGFKAHPNCKCSVRRTVA